MSGATSTVADTAGVEIEMEPAGPDTTNSDLVERLVAQARVDGVQLAGEGGLLAQLTRRVLESALEGEITDHLGYDRHDPAGRDGGNSRNGSRAETVLTDVGPVEVAVPRDRDGSFAPKIVRKRQRRVSRFLRRVGQGFIELTVCSCCSPGLLIHAVVGRAGGLGCWRTNRSGLRV